MLLCTPNKLHFGGGLMDIQAGIWPTGNGCKTASPRFAAQQKTSLVCCCVLMPKYPRSLSSIGRPEGLEGRRRRRGVGLVETSTASIRPAFWWGSWEYLVWGAKSSVPHICVCTAFFVSTARLMLRSLVQGYPCTLLHRLRRATSRAGIGKVRGYKTSRAAYTAGVGSLSDDSWTTLAAPALKLGSCKKSTLCVFAHHGTRPGAM